MTDTLFWSAGYIVHGVRRRHDGHRTLEARIFPQCKRRTYEPLFRRKIYADLASRTSSAGISKRGDSPFKFLSYQHAHRRRKTIKFRLPKQKQMQYVMYVVFALGSNVSSFSSYSSSNLASATIQLQSVGRVTSKTLASSSRGRLVDCEHLVLTHTFGPGAISIHYPIRHGPRQKKGVSEV